MIFKQFQAIIFPNLLIICTSAVLWTSRSVDATRVIRPRGVSLAKASLYNSETDFTCLDGSATFPFKYVNDDYCDCQDGSDEPGTAACPNGSFYCRNFGHAASVLPSSRVNDGICDCCDGTDEYASATTCVNTCKEMGAAAQEDALRRYELESQGYSIKLDYINKGKQAKVAQQERAQALKAEQVEVEALRAEKEKEKQEAEDPEKKALDKYRVEETEALKEKEASATEVEDGAEQAFEWLDSNQDEKIQVAELQSHNAFDQNGDGIVSVEEAKFYLYMEEEIEKSEFIRSAWRLMKPAIMKEQEKFKPTEEVVTEKPSETQEQPSETQEQPSETQEQPSETQEQPEESHLEEGDSEEEVGEDSDVRPSPVAPTQVEYDDETKALIEAANKARDAYDEADRRLRDIEREIRTLEDTSSKDYGLNEEFQPLDNQCYEYSDREYTYKLCPFDNASQRPKHGGSETRLGSWESWDGHLDDKYSKMRYTKGVQCWNGPQRSVVVHLACGMENQVLSVSEPNRCEYEMKFTTPAVCKEPQKPTDNAEIHDEL